MKYWIALLALPLFGQMTEKERALGEHLATEIRRQSQPAGHAEVQAYAKRIGARLAERLPSRYEFEVIVTDAPEPMPIPGGHIFIPAAFFLKVRDEAGFASMLAHAIAHIELARQEFRKGSPLVVMGSWTSLHPVPHGNEIEVDKLGAEIADRAGYGSQALSTAANQEFLRMQETVRQALGKHRAAPSLRR